MPFDGALRVLSLCRLRKQFPPGKGVAVDFRITGVDVAVQGFGDGVGIGKGTETAHQFDVGT